MHGLNPFRCMGIVRTNAGGEFERCVARIKSLRLDAIVDANERRDIWILIPGDGE